MHELKTVCQKWNITLCGGHTEITDAVTRPVLTGLMAGTVSKKDLIDKRHMKSGDKILLTKCIAVEGTAIIAREFEVKLKRLGMSETEIETCRQFLSQISILKEAQIASRFKGVSAMHDITEGGLSTAVEVLSSTSGRIKRFNTKNPNASFYLNLDIEPDLPFIDGDPQSLEQMFINLVDNAVKYTDKGKITIAITKPEKEDKENCCIEIQVKNTGLPIPAKSLPRIFERFYVVDKSRSRKLGGTGLGLSIVKHVVLLHKGEISVDSTPEQGTIFTLRLPLSPGKS